MRLRTLCVKIHLHNQRFENKTLQTINILRNKKQYSINITTLAIKFQKEAKFMVHEISEFDSFHLQQIKY